MDTIGGPTQTYGQQSAGPHPNLTQDKIYTKTCHTEALNGIVYMYLEAIHKLLHTNLMIFLPLPDPCHISETPLPSVTSPIFQFYTKKLFN